MRMPVLLVTALTPVVWGTTYAVTTEFLPAGRPFLSGVLRALPAGLLLLALTRQLPRGAWWWRAAVLGTLNIGLFFGLLFVTAYRLPGGMAAVLGAVQPLVVAGLTVLVLRDRVSVRTVICAIAGAAGVTLAVLTATTHLDPVGIGAGLAGTMSMALGLVLTKRWGQPGVSPLTVTGWQLTAGGLLLAPVALALEGPPPALTPVNMAGYAYLSLVGTALAYTIWFRGLDRLPAVQVSLLGLLSPVAATALGWIALGEELTTAQLVGMVVAFSAVAAGASIRTHAAPGTAASPPLTPGTAAAQQATPKATVAQQVVPEAAVTQQAAQGAAVTQQAVPEMGPARPGHAASGKDSAQLVPARTGTALAAVPRGWEPRHREPLPRESLPREAA